MIGARSTFFVGVVAAAAGLAGLESAVGGRVPAVGCDLAIDQFDRPADQVQGMRLVLQRVWLPKTSTVLQLSPRRRGEDRFAKWGLVVRAGPPVRLEVPQNWRRTYSLVYTARQVKTVGDGQPMINVAGCPATNGRWSAFAGGYEVRRRVCAPLVLHANGRVARVRLSVGMRCADRSS